MLVGRDRAKDIWPLRQSLQNTTAIVVKRAPPLSLRSWPEWFPEINPRDHADLIQDLRAGSRWASDFVGMLALASAIATLGLMQNSPAVVIGSMLLAPLMTPMIGTGLALAQANMSGAKYCAKSIAYGFLLTLAVSFLLGMITPSRETLSPEVLSRGAPNVLDLLIALFAAMAATFATGPAEYCGGRCGRCYCDSAGATCLYGGVIAVEWLLRQCCGSDAGVCDQPDRDHSRIKFYLLAAGHFDESFIAATSVHRAVGTLGTGGSPCCPGRATKS
jgi:uncharacterized hydrophobic protein (TIGR00271 family)